MITIKTMSSIPITDKVAMALAVIPRAGVKFIQSDPEKIPVMDMTGQARTRATDPLQASYFVEGQEVHLVGGRSEVEAAPGSATRIKTWVFGEPVYGDLDGDGDRDAALLLVHDSGGSGTFYYVAAALNVEGSYIGTNAVLLGDRVAPQDIRIRNGVFIVNYADRRPEEPMNASPSMAKSAYLTIRGRELVALGPLGEGEQVLEGWVTIGHEARSFLPCSRQGDLWLLGNSPALSEIMSAYRAAPHDPKPYAPVFMILAGRHSARPTDGFGAQYRAAFFATQLVRVSPEGKCMGE